MSTSRRSLTTSLAAAALLVALAAGCGGDDDDNDDGGNSQIPNPASVFCEEQGGTVSIVTADDGSQSGLCQLPDGTEVDEWEYYRANNPDATTP